MKVIIIFMILFQTVTAQTVKEKLDKIATFKVSNGDILLRMKNNMIYQENHQSDNELIRTAIGQEIVLKKGFEQAIFFERHFSITIKKMITGSADYTLIEKADDPRKQEYTTTKISFDIVKDKIVEASNEQSVERTTKPQTGESNKKDSLQVNRETKKEAEPVGYGMWLAIGAIVFVLIWLSASKLFNLSRKTK
ncbi:MAG: hypothetical protein ACI9SQ_000928 [Rubritalea sp.]|jgi:hypothetical protein